MKKLLAFALLLLVISKLHAQKLQTIGVGNTKNVTVTASKSSATALNTLLGTGFLPNENAASRFLSQATFGATLNQINSVSSQGIEKWLDDQLASPNNFLLKNYVQLIHQGMVDSLRQDNPSGNYTLQNTFVDDWLFDVAWFQGAMTTQNHLRWKVAFALSELFVVSRRSAFDGNPYALASYYDMLMNNAFGNYRALIDSVTYHPSMAVYLTFMNNHATDTTDNKKVFPDENYAREIMQLFSIGLFKLNNDGTPQLDGNGQTISTYNNNDIAGLAKVFTGLSWGDSRYLGDRDKDKWSYTRRLKFFPIDSSDAYKRWWVSNPRIVNGHEPGPKTFLGQTIPARPVAQGQQDIQDALNVLYNHPNVGPFIARRLIQRLVKSNPSSAYIGRVASVFNNNGQNVRGDLKAVVRAVLLDSEARECECKDTDSTYNGHLREPFLRYMNLVKGLNLSATSGYYRNMMNVVFDNTDQKPLYSPSVFNFFLPDYKPDGVLKNAGKYGPEFQLMNAQSYAGYINALHEWLINNDPVDYAYFQGESVYKPEQDPNFDLTAEYPLLFNNRLDEFLDKYNLLLAHGALSEKSIQLIKNAIVQMPLHVNSDGSPDENDAFRRQRVALLLIMSSPEYMINR